MKICHGWVLAALSLVALNCGGDSTSPTSPTAPSTPTIAQVAGVWTGTATLTSVTGGECVGTVLQSAVGSADSFTAAVTQTGSTLSATITSQSSGLSCSYSGTAGSNTVTLNLTTCQVDTLLDVQCAGGVLRDMQLIAEGITGTVSGNTVSGTTAETWNVFIAGTTVGVGPLTLNSTFTMAR